jgi:hypothetical protein
VRVIDRAACGEHQQQLRCGLRQDLEQGLDRRPRLVFVPGRRQLPHDVERIGDAGLAAKRCQHAVPRLARVEPVELL